MNCPRCNGPLQERDVGPATVRTCAWCTGTLIRQAQLVPLLTWVAETSLGEIGLETPIPRLPDAGVRLPCPQCGKTMDPFGYLGTNLVTADRCPDDWLVWADPGELGTMALLHARTNRRTDQRNAVEKERRDERLRHMALLIDGRRAARNGVSGGLSAYERQQVSDEINGLMRFVFGFERDD